MSTSQSAEIESPEPELVHWYPSRPLGADEGMIRALSLVGAAALGLLAIGAVSLAVAGVERLVSGKPILIRI